MTQYSYSRVDLFNQCPHHFKLRYIDRLTELNEFKADNPLLIGTALHTGAETNKRTMLEEYYKQFPVITDEQITEAVKLEVIQEKVKIFLQKYIDAGCELIHEYKIDTDDYVGYVDLIIKAPDGTCQVMDFKYSNNVKNYVGSPQLHIYQYYLEKEGFNIDGLSYLFAPKISIKMKKRNKTNKRDESVTDFRKRSVEELKKKDLTHLPIVYNPKHIKDFKVSIKKIEAAKDYPKNPDDNCFQCLTIAKAKSGGYFPFSPPDYLQTIQNTNGEILMALPKNERRNIEKVEKRVIWLYGAPFTGKTTFANTFPDPIMLNTDGNIRFVDAPFVSIANKVESTGRVTNTTLAWDILKDAITDLEKKDNDFKTVIVDLVEDTYEACRLYMYDKLGIEHESDDSFRAWDKVRTEFLSTFKRLVHLPYENIIFLSHEDMSKDITKKGGDKTTAIKPNLADKPALKIAGMVDIVARVVADDDDRRITFKSLDYVFGGGRLPNLPVNEIELDRDKLFEVYDEANANLVKSKHKLSPKPKPEVNEDGEAVDNNGEVLADQPKKRGRKKKKEEDEGDVKEDEPKKRSPRKKKEEVKKENDAKEVVEESEPEAPKKSERKKREPIEDDQTPPGESEEKSDPEPEKTEEKPKRERRSRRGK